MAHWGWYWNVKLRGYIPQKTCSSFWLCEIDSFKMFNKRIMDLFLKYSQTQILLEIPRYKLTISLQDDNSLNVVYVDGNYIIPTERKSCNFGGFYTFFCCPQCNAGMRKLYCLEGKYICRKCANLGYYSQRLRKSERCARMCYDIQDRLKNQTGSLEKKPPYMSNYTFQKLRIKFVKYNEMQFDSSLEELDQWRGDNSASSSIDPYYISMPYNLYDAYVERSHKLMFD